MLHVNELDSDKHLHATYIEFLEAYARACDLASFPHHNASSEPLLTQED